MKKRQSRILRLAVVVALVAMLGTVGYEVFYSFKVKYQIAQAKDEQQLLEEEKTELKNEISKLKDDNYLQSYVSGTIFSTEKGTTIFILPEQEETPE